jgi:hypothetical protein
MSGKMASLASETAGVKVKFVSCGNFIAYPPGRG